MDASAERGWQHRELTQAIIGLCIDVARELGSGFLESVYHEALIIAFQDAGIHATSEPEIPVFFRGKKVGCYVPDFVVAESVVLELKAVQTLATEHQAQVINALAAIKKNVGLLVNFGTHRLQIKRCFR